MGAEPAPNVRAATEPATASGQSGWGLTPCCRCCGVGRRRTGVCAGSPLSDSVAEFGSDSARPCAAKLTLVVAWVVTTLGPWRRGAARIATRAKGEWLGAKPVRWWGGSTALRFGVAFGDRRGSRTSCGCSVWGGGWAVGVADVGLPGLLGPMCGGTNVKDCCEADDSKVVLSELPSPGTAAPTTAVAAASLT